MEKHDKHLCMYDLEYILIEIIECLSTAQLWVPYDGKNPINN